MDQALQRHAQRLTAVIDTQNEILKAERNLQAVMNVVVAQTQAVTHADGAVVQLLEGEELVYRAVSGSALPHLGLRLGLHSSISGRCIREGKVLLCMDTETDFRVDRESCRRVGIGSVIVVPLLHQRVRIGVLEILSSRPYAFEEEDAATLQVMAGLIAAAMNDAMGREREQALAAERQTMLETLQKSEERLRSLATATALIFWTADSQGRLTTISDNGLEYAGMTLKEMQGTGWMDMVHPHDSERTALRWAEAVKNRTMHEGEYRLRRDDGAYRDFTVRSVPLLNADGSLREWVGQCRDVTEQKQVQEAIRQSEARFRAAVEGSTDAFILLKGVRDSGGTILDFVYLDANHCWATWTGRSRANTIGKTLTEVWSEELCEPVIAWYRRAVETQQTLEDEAENLLPETRPIWMYAQIIPFGDCVAVTIRDISERRWLQQRLEEQITQISEVNTQLEAQQRELAAANARLEILAQTDGLTGLKNHRTFQERLAEEIQRATRYKLPLSLLLIDVDCFKAYNDAFGHPAGDQVLKQVAQILQSNIRVSDLAARYGGEEFVILLPHTEAEGAHQMAENLRGCLEQALWPQRAITASFGVATLTVETLQATTLVAQADAALYHSKRQGRNCVSHFADLRSGAEAAAHSPASGTFLSAPQADSAFPVASLDGLTNTYDRTIEGWSRMLDLRDKETEGHALRVTEMSLRLAQRMNMSDEEQGYLRWGALLHDVGKMVIPDSILLKPGPLTSEERAIMNHHPTYAHDMLSPVPFLRPALDVPLYHHEKWDGSGYPYGLQGAAIPLAARLFAVVDVWDALRSDRPYRQGWPDIDVQAYIEAQSGQHFDPDIVPIFLALLAEEAVTAVGGAVSALPDSR
jgi:diguanylate cyclase (GGDEF)-like protein/PAS domain S-box-containing protein